MASASSFSSSSSSSYSSSSASLLTLRLLLLPLLLLAGLLPPSSTTSSEEQLPPLVTLVLLVRDKAHALPYTLGAIERLDYNSSRLSMAIFLDHSSDASEAALQRWLRANSARYAWVHLKVNSHPREYPNEAVRLDWPPARVLNVLRLRQLGLELARSQGSQFAFFLDADALLTNPAALRHLVAQNRSLIAPLLNCSTEPDYAANFWGAIDPASGHYRRSDTYMDIRSRRQLGTFQVSVVHTAFLLSLAAASSEFRFHPVPEDYPASWLLDDLPIMHAAAVASGVLPELDNSLDFGAYPQVDRDLFADYLHRATDLEVGAFKHTLLEYHYHHNGQSRLEPAPSLASFAFPIGGHRRLGFDRIYVISLTRRPDRLERMRYALDLLGIEWRHFPAVDGRELNSTSLLHRRGIEPLAGYADPYHGRGLTAGEVGCFLSHHGVWQEVIQAGLRRVLILEDDARFGHSFEERLALTLEEADRLKPSWELLYLGRKIMHPSDERLVDGARYLAVPSYTYWTLAYGLSLSGAKKLVEQRPLGKLVAVDEYLPIMFDRHPNAEWKARFQPRDLVAVSAAPLLLQPNYYIGMPHYVSDTEKSHVFDGSVAAEAAAAAAGKSGGTCSAGQSARGDSNCAPPAESKIGG